MHAVKIRNDVVEKHPELPKTLFRYSHEQGLASKRLRIEDLFHPSTLEFEEK